MPLRSKRKRRKLSMTSLIDVIFLLLLFFMLSSTFSKFAEVDLQAATGGAGAGQNTNLMFLRVTKDSFTLNGNEVGISDLKPIIQSLQTDQKSSVLVNVTTDVTAQSLTDILVALRSLPNLNVNVMGAS